MLADVVRARDELCVDWPDVARDHVRVGETANAYGTIEALPDEIHKPIAIGSIDLKERVSPRQFREHRGQINWTQGQWRCNS
jgi:hypothetical protein